MAGGRGRGYEKHNRESQKLNSSFHSGISAEWFAKSCCRGQLAAEALSFYELSGLPQIWPFGGCSMSDLQLDPFIFLDLAAVFWGDSAPIRKCSTLNGHNESDSLRLGIDRSGNEGSHADREPLSDIITARS